MIGAYEGKNNFTLRPNEAIVGDIQTAIWKEDIIRSLDGDSVSVEAHNGEVFLDGHVAREQNRQLIEDIAWTVPGVIMVNNRIVTDRDLTIEVAQALAKDERTRPYILRVGSMHGWISLGGAVPTPEAQLAAEEVAGQAPAVRGVISLPRVSGESKNLARRAIQPRIGAYVYGENGQAGVVTQVVINPNNRLVSHAVARVGYEVERWPVNGEYLLPVEAIDRVNAESIFLIRGLPLSAYPVFHTEEHPRAPLSWQPPYPYRSDAVRWPLAALPSTSVELSLELLLGLSNRQ